MNQNTAKIIRQLRIAAILEGISYLLLLGVTMPLKYWMDMPEPNMLVGYAHGLLFIAYIGLVLIVAYRYRWPAMPTLIALGASLLPFATFYVEAKMLRKEALITPPVTR